MLQSDWSITSIVQSGRDKIHQTPKFEANDQKKFFLNLSKSSYMKIKSGKVMLAGTIP